MKTHHHPFRGYPALRAVVNPALQAHELGVTITYYTPALQAQVTVVQGAFAAETKQQSYDVERLE